MSKKTTIFLWWSGFVLGVIFLSLVLVYNAILGPAWAAQPQSEEGRIVNQLGPTPTSTPLSEWVGQIVSETADMSLAGTILRVSVEGLKGLPVKVSSDDWSTIGLTGTKSEYGEYVVEFAPLSRGYYIIEPLGLGTTVTFYADTKSYIFVRFTRQTGPEPSPLPTTMSLPTWPPTPLPTPLPPPTLIPSLTPTPISSPEPTPTPEPPSPSPTPIYFMVPATPSIPQTQPLWQGRIVYQIEGPFHAALVVRVLGPKGIPVEIKSDGWQATALTGTKSEYGDFSCEFGGLTAGTYTVTPLGLGTSLEIKFGTGGFAIVEFVQQQIVTPTAPPWPPSGWFGRVVQQVSGAERGIKTSAIAVRVLGLKDVPVELRADGFSVTALTGTKPEYGDFACEFGGLSAGTYIITPLDLGADLTVTVDQGEFALVEFTYQPLPTPPAPSILPLEVLWSGRVLLNTSERESRGTSSVIIVQVPGIDGLPVEIRTESFSATALTGTQPEYGRFACGFHDLWPGTYEIIPQGLGASLQVTVDGQGLAVVEFTARPR